MIHLKYHVLLFPKHTNSALYLSGAVCTKAWNRMFAHRDVFKIERQTTHSRRHLVTIRSRRVIVRMLSGTCRVLDLRSRDRDSNLTGSTALCLIVCEQDVHPLHSTDSTQEDLGGGGGGSLIFFDKRRLGPSIYHTPPKKSGISSTPKKYLKF